MKKRIYHIEPVLESFVWGGRGLIDRYSLKTDLDNVGQVYHVIAIPNHRDNIVRETGGYLSELYLNSPELFDCKCPTFPVRLATESSKVGERTSIQVHPDNKYALEHEGTLGKVSGGMPIEGFRSKTIVRKLGHTCKTKEEFEKLVENRDWDTLYQRITVEPDEFVNTPAGVIHGGETKTGSMSVVFASNSDITYRLYDFDRNDPNRPLHIKQVYDCLHFPEVEIKKHKITSEVIDGVTIYNYYSQKEEYVAKRLEVDGKGHFELNEFYFIACVDGKCKVNEEELNIGETLFIPAHFGKITLEGNAKIFLISYID